MNIKEFFTKWPKTRGVKIFFLIIAVLIETLFVFQAGVAVGFHKAAFSFNSASNYKRNFENPSGRLGGGMMNSYTNAHGTFGKIISIASTTIVVADSDNTEKRVLIDSSTLIRRFRENINLTDLKVNDYITVIGIPTDNGELKAALLRIMPNGDQSAGRPGGMMNF